MANRLSVDDVFCVVEFLDGQDVGNVLLACKEWNTLDENELFWKTIFNHFLVSNIVEQFEKLEGYGLATNWSKIDVKKVLSNQKDMQNKYALLTTLRSVKFNNELKNYLPYIVDKGILQSVLLAYENHILKDETASRISLKTLENHEEDRKNFTGKRFKHLVRKQLVSVDSITFSSYFGAIDENNEHTLLVSNFLLTQFGKEILLENAPQKKLTMEYQKVQDGIFSRLLGSPRGINHCKYWEILVGICLQHFPQVVHKDHLPEVLLKLFTVYNYRIKLSWVSILFNNIEYYHEQLDLIEKLFIEKGLDSNDKISHDYLGELFGSKEYHHEVNRKVQLAVKYLTYLEKFKSKEFITNTLVTSPTFYAFIARLSIEPNYLSDFLELYPIPFEKLSLEEFNSARNTSNTLLLLNIAKQKGYLYPQPEIEELIKKTPWYFSQTTSEIIRFLLDNFEDDIYEIDKRNLFFTDFISTISGIVGFELFVSQFETLFKHDPVDLNKFLKVHPTIFTVETLKIVEMIYDMSDPEEFVAYLNNHFIQNIIDMSVLIATLDQYHDRGGRPIIKKLLFENCMFSETEKLSDHVKKLLKEKPELIEDIDPQGGYEIDDPRFAIFLQQYCN